jgi:ABC-2 type transport system permease protein
MVVGGHSVYPLWLSFGVMGLVFLLLLALASRLYPGLVR